MNEGLEGKPAGDPRRQHGTKAIGSLSRYVEPSIGQPGIEADHQQATYQP